MECLVAAQRARARRPTEMRDQMKLMAASMIVTGIRTNPRPTITQNPFPLLLDMAALRSSGNEPRTMRGGFL
jgi:hypothetical protein